MTVLPRKPAAGQYPACFTGCFSYAIAQTRRERSTTRLICWPLRRQSHQRHPHRTRTTFRIGRQLDRTSRQQTSCADSREHHPARPAVQSRRTLRPGTGRAQPTTAPVTLLHLRYGHLGHDRSARHDARRHRSAHTRQLDDQYRCSPPFRKTHDGGPDRRKHPRNRYPIHSRNQFQPQGLHLRRQCLGIRNAERARFVLYVRSRGRPQFLRRHSATQTSQGVPKADGLRSRRDLHRHAVEILLHRTRHIGTGQSPQFRLVGRLVEANPPITFERISDRPLQPRSIHRTPRRRSKSQSGASRPQRSADGASVSIENASSRPIWSTDSARKNMWQRATRPN